MEKCEGADLGAGGSIHVGRDKDGELMNVTENYGLKKPEKNEYISVDVINENIDAIDTELKKKD